MRENKILSQAEIEALLAFDASSDTADEADAGGAAAGPAATAVADAPAGAPAKPAKPAKVYDFRRPDKFSKEHLRSLRILHESFARMLGQSLTSYLSAGVQVRLTMLEQGTYDEYIQSLPTPTVIYIVGLAPLPGQAVVEVNLPVARVILDRLLGGSGVPSGKPNAEMTEIEFALLKTIGGFILSSLRDAWSNVVPLRPTMQEPVLSPELAQFATLAEATVMLVLEIALFNTTGTISMCIPYQVLQPIMDSLTAQVWFGSSPRADDARLDFQEPMADVTLPVTVELGRTEMPLSALLELRPGQVIKLGAAADAPLPVRVNEQTKFLARPGLQGKNIAVQIVHTLAE
jgi:flagellar motor switch protein FliM